jgi:hypothetical protein
MRLTRAALRAEAQCIDSETADASHPHTDPQERVPLTEVSPNTAIEPEAEVVYTAKMPAKKSKVKGGAKKGAKERNGKSSEDQVELVEVLEDERLAAGSPASDAAVDELAKETADIAATPVSDGQDATVPSRAVRTTRRQLAKQQDAPSRLLRSRTSPQHPTVGETAKMIAGVPEGLAEEAPSVEEAEKTEERKVGAPDEALKSEPSNVEAQRTKRTVIVPDVQEVLQPHKPAVDTPTIQRSETLQLTQEPEVTTAEQQLEATPPLVRITSEPEPKVLTSEKPCQETSTPATSHTPSHAPSRSQSKSPARSPMRIEESIEAFDALEEALENVGKAIVFDHSADEEKSPRKAVFSRSPMSKKSPLAPKVVTKPSVTPRQSLKPTATRSSIVRSSSVRAPAKERKPSGEVSDYLASKRRPISMSFPTPPPPLKSTKAPTKATFQLPGEAVAAKLKAQKEERLKRETEAGATKPQPLSMPPPPKSTKAPTKPNFQLPGEAIAAKLKAQKEERLRREAGGEEPATRQVSMPPRLRSAKPPTVANFQLPGDAIAAKLKAQKEERLKREEEAGSAKRVAFKARPAPVRKTGPEPVRQTVTSKARESLMSKENGVTTSTSVGKRGSIVLSRSISVSSADSSNRNNMIMSAGAVAKSAVTPTDAAAQKVKGKQVFNRDKMEKETRDRERKEKEEAAKKARAEAAERGRIASREWAQKQRRKLMSNAAVMKTDTA